MTIPIVAASALSLAAILASTQNMNWPEIITTLTAAASGFITLWFNLTGRREKQRAELEEAKRRAELADKLQLIAAETAAAKERAEYAAMAVVQSKEERREQLARVERKIDESKAASETALEAANGHKATIAQATQQMVELREDLNKFAKNQPETAV